MLKLIFLTLFSSFLTISKAQDPTVKYSSAKLAGGGACSRLHYNGADSIYIFSGCNTTLHTQISKYSIKSDTISKIGSLPSPFVFGSVVSNEDGSLFLFGGGKEYNQVIKYDAIKNATEISAILPWDVRAHPTVANCVSKNSAIILGSKTSNSIKRYDFETKKITNSSAQLPIDLTKASAICVAGRIFVFPYFKNGNQSVWEFEPNSQKLFPVGQPHFPILQPFPSPVSDGTFIYTIAGFAQNQTLLNHNYSKSAEGLLRFDPQTNSSDFIPVGNWPVKDGERFYEYGPQCVFAGRWKRIYCFGGNSQKVGDWEDGEEDFRFDDEIFYIDMSDYSEAK